MKVLHLLDSFSFGGAENLVIELARHQPPGFTIEVASIARRGDRDAMLDRFLEAGLEPDHLGLRRLLDPPGVVSVVRALRRSDADVVHTHLQTATIVGTVCARLAGKPVVSTLHHHPADLPLRGRVKEYLSVRLPGRLGRLILVSDAAYAEFARRFGPANPRWRMIYNGVDLARFPAATAYRPGRDRDLAWAGRADLRSDHVWASVAALRPLKGHLDLLAAWEQVLRRHPSAHLVIIGDGVSRRAIEGYVRTHDLGDRVTLLGRRDDVPDLLQHVDGVVSASHTEALPTALIEAASTGLPVVATRAGGTVDIVRDGETGYLVPVRDVDALAAGLIRCLDDPARMAELGRAGRRRVEREFSMKIWVERLATLYREVSGFDAAGRNVDHPGPAGSTGSGTRSGSTDSRG